MKLSINTLAIPVFQGDQNVGWIIALAVWVGCGIFGNITYFHWMDHKWSELVRTGQRLNQKPQDSTWALRQVGINSWVIPVALILIRAAIVLGIVCGVVGSLSSS